MENLDLKYLCSVIGNLAGIPIRLYQNEKLIFYHSIVDLPVDPISLYHKELFGNNLCRAVILLLRLSITTVW